ncbi:MAG: ribose-phosphate diphosphokinase [Burkholderiales bacterium]
MAARTEDVVRALSLIALPGAEGTAERLAQALQAPRCPLETRHFPDGETYLRVLDDVEGRELLVVASLRDPDPQLPPLLFLADALHELGAARVGLVAPYLPYMRQDERFHPGEAVTQRSFAAWIGAAFDGLVTVDPHLHRVATLDAVYRIPGVVASSAAAIAAWVRANVPHPHLVGPDEESAQWVGAVARAAGCGHSVLRKTRRGDRDVQVTLPDMSAADGCTPVLVDDIVSSAHTLAVAVGALRAAGLAAPVCVAVHAVFGEGAEQLLREAGADRVLSCNTLPHATNAIDVTLALAKAVAALRAAWRREP